jgi:hypothetical protein
MEKTRRHVIDRVRAAFEHVKRPQILAATYYDDWEMHHFEDFFATKAHWSCIEPEVIEKEFCALRFLTPEAFAFFLPAYMIWTLENFDRPGAYDAAYRTIESLDPGAKAGAIQCFTALNADQHASIRAFLTFMAEQPRFAAHTRVRKHLDRYWANPEHEPGPAP